jgi:hypothetical protein
MVGFIPSSFALGLLRHGDIALAYPCARPCMRGGGKALRVGKKIRGLFLSSTFVRADGFQNCCKKKTTNVMTIKQNITA